MKTALITGVSGQDGIYLCEQLLAKGYNVIGGTRDHKKAFDKLPFGLASKIKLVSFDMLDLTTMAETLYCYQPHEVYNLAAFTSGSGMFDDPASIGKVNGIGVALILEAIRRVNPEIRFCQASSREVFGDAIETPQAESTLRNPRNPYGAAKVYADSMVQIYRQHYGLFACSAILFNHESPNRGIDFVTRKISSGAVKIKLGLAHELALGNLDIHRDWGFAGDYVHGMWLMLQQSRPDDYVLATGVTHSIRDFCDYAFGRLGLDYQDYVKTDPSSYRVSEAALLVGDAQKASDILGWKPTTNFQQLVAMMVDSDLQLFSQKDLG